MEVLLPALINTSGMGLCAAVLFYLHTQATKNFREDLAAERKICAEHHAAGERAAEARHEEHMDTARETLDELKRGRK